MNARLRRKILATIGRKALRTDVERKVVERIMIERERQRAQSSINVLLAFTFVVSFDSVSSRAILTPFLL